MNCPTPRSLHQRNEDTYPLTDLHVSAVSGFIYNCKKLENTVL